MSKLTLSINEVAEQLSIGRTTVYRLVKCGELPSFKIGRSRRVSAKSLEEFVQRMDG